jgi:hypothetical protein
MDIIFVFPLNDRLFQPSFEYRFLIHPYLKNKHEKTVIRPAGRIGDGDDVFFLRSCKERL